MVRKILIYCIGSLGDTIVTIPALRAVRKRYPDGRIYLLYDRQVDSRVTPEEVLAESGLVDEYFFYQAAKTLSEKIFIFTRLCRVLRGLDIQTVVYLAPSVRSVWQVHRDKFFLRVLCGIKNTVGFIVFSNNKRVPVDAEGRPTKLPHEASYRLQRLGIAETQPDVSEFFSVPLIKVQSKERMFVQNWLVQNRKYPNRPLIAICPGAKQSAKLWPIQRFEEIGKYLISLHKFELVILGAQNERRTGQNLVERWREGLNLAGILSIVQSAALLSQCSLAITLDSGPMHLAAAVGTKVFSIFAYRERPGLWDPLGKGHTVLRYEVPCACCHADRCPIAGHPCMERITAEDVKSRLDRVIQELGI
jgi:ADP-heptose:LPS heptosyltransferase